MTAYNLAKVEETALSFRLSPIQRRTWSLHRLGPAFRAEAAFSVEGVIDHAKLKGALDQLVRRHEILHTRFSFLPGTEIPVQRIDLDGSYTYRLRESTAVRITEAEIVETVLQEFGEKVVDLADDPLFHVTVISRQAARPLLVFTLPAICGDSATLRILCRELMLLYRGGDLDSPVQFAEIAEWQNSLLEGQDTESGRAHWRRREIEQTLASPVFPKEHFEFRSVTLCPGATLTDSVKAIADRMGVPPSDLCLACWQIWLWRFRGQSPMVSGILCDGRKFEELAGAPGPLQKYVPMSIELRPSMALQELLSTVRQKRQEAVRLQEFFEWPLRTETETPNGMPFFSACFDGEWQSPTAAHGLYGVVKESFCCDLFQIKLRINNSMLDAEICYDPTLYSREYICCVADSFVELLESASKSPDSRIGDLNLLPEKQRRELVVEINDTEAAYCLDRTVTDLFEERLGSHPSLPAVRIGEKEVTYAELNLGANRLAHFLRNAGVRGEDRVGICLEHSFILFTALLGVLKAGAAYIPLDPETPPERIAYILQDARPSLVLTSAALRGKIAECAGLRILCLDELEENLAHQCGENLSVPVLPEQLAYVIYTSGSTGRPKGVMVSHKGLTNYLLWSRDAYSAKRARGVPAFSPLGFDLTITSLFVPLLAGDTAILYPGQNGLDSLANDGGFTFVKLTPAHLQILAQYLPKEKVQNWSGALVVGGEALSTELVSFWLQRDPGARIVNEYGPTETVVGCCVHEVRQVDLERATIPIGRPIANMKMYVLDAAMRPVPVGVTGELYIGGVNLARGYVGSPGITAERFVPDPLGATYGGRLYKTGDLGRWLPEHSIEFLGRTDCQVKLRGFRVELGEIESVLEQIPQVQQAVVMMLEDQPGDQRLVAYFVPRNPNQPGAMQIRKALTQVLPDYMVPSAFIPLKAMPLTANGKIDRQALLDPNRYSKAIIFDYNPPQGLVESEVARIWEQILNVARVGANDDFFELGGHSLLAVRVMARIAEVFAVRLPVAVLFEASTLRKLAEVVESGQKAAPTPPLPILLRKGGPQRPLYFVECDPGFVYKDLLDCLSEERPFYSLQMAFAAKGENPDSSIEQIAERRVHAVLQADTEGPYFLVGHSLAGLVAFEMAQQLTQQGREDAFVGILDMGLDTPKVPANADDATVLEYLFGQQFGTATDHFRSLSPDDQIAHVADAAVKMQRVPAGTEREHILRYIELWKANLRALSNYEPKLYGGRVALFKAAEKLSFRYYSADPTMGWDRIGSSRLRVLNIPGNHYTLLTNNNAQEVSHSLQLCLNQIGSEW
jgi:amino acid adenylation domain-containing protein